MGGVVPSGEAGGVLAALLGDDGYPAGRLIMMLRVTFTGVSSLPDAGDGGTNAAASPAGSARGKRETKRQVRSKGTPTPPSTIGVHAYFLLPARWPAS
jgi:hypothetical protein